MMLALAIAALTLLPTDDVVTDTVDVIEVNHVYTDNGQHTLSQVIFWRRNDRAFEVADWRLLKHDSQRPTKNFRSGMYETIFHDGEVTRRVEARVFRETWTQHDVEISERRVCPKEQRSLLTAWREGEVSP